MEILCWDRGDDQRAELLECYGQVTLWQATKWLGALNDTDMCDKDVVVVKLMKMTFTATALYCGVLWMRCLARSEPVKLVLVLAKSEAVGLSRSSRVVRLEPSIQRTRVV